LKRTHLHHGAAKPASDWPERSRPGGRLSLCWRLPEFGRASRGAPALERVLHFRRRASPPSLPPSLSRVRPSNVLHCIQPRYTNRSCILIICYRWTAMNC